MSLDHDPTLPPEAAAIAVRGAHEGIPIAAIARMLRHPFEDTLNCLVNAKREGLICMIPKSDWQPAQRLAARGPTIPQTPNPEETEFACKQVFKLTNLEVGFLMVLLRHVFAEKEKLHAVIEQQRNARAYQPDNQEATDPKMVDVMICKLRKKLRALSPEYVIQTSWGRGYFLDQAIKDMILARAIAGEPHAGGPAAERTAPADAPA